MFAKRTHTPSTDCRAIRREIDTHFMINVIFLILEHVPIGFTSLDFDFSPEHRVTQSIVASDGGEVCCMRSNELINSDFRTPWLWLNVYSLIASLFFKFYLVALLLFRK